MNSTALDAIRLRPVTGEDEGFVYQVYASTREEELSILDWSPAQKASFLRMQHRAQQRFYAEHFSTAAFDLVLYQDEPIGRLYVDRRSDEIRIIDIALLTEHRKKAIGSTLLGSIVEEGNRTHLSVRIHVECNNRALHLYQRLGFRQLSDNGIYFLMEKTPS